MIYLRCFRLLNFLSIMEWMLFRIYKSIQNPDGIIRWQLWLWEISTLFSEKEGINLKLF